MKLAAALVILTACEPEPVPLPEVWGGDALTNLSTERGVVEVELQANTARASWMDDADTTVWTYNGSVPGPILQGRVGDTLRVHFTNNLPAATTIHWHGVRVPDTMDGVPAVQQPIEPGETFTYEFVLRDAGTFWYHPHVRTNRQVEKGLYGTLIVHEADPPPVDMERVFVLDDVSLYDDGEFTTFDLGRAPMDGMHGRHGNILLTNGETGPRTATVMAGSVERWRIVNTANARILYADVTGATWRVIAVDGTLLEEPWVDQPYLVFPVGRRFDLEVVPEGTGPVTLRTLLPNTDGGFDPIEVFSGDVVGKAPAGSFLSYDTPKMPQRLDHEQKLEITLGANDANGMAWTINDATYVEGNNIPVRGGVPTRIVIEDTSGAPHPFHLHGQFFEIVRRNGGLPVTPGSLDTVLIEPEETVVLYTIMDNPGSWLAHCHILEHAELGMMTTFEVSAPSAAK